MEESIEAGLITYVLNMWETVHFWNVTYIIVINGLRWGLSLAIKKMYQCYLCVTDWNLWTRMNNIKVNFHRRHTEWIQFRCLSEPQHFRWLEIVFSVASTSEISRETWVQMIKVRPGWYKRLRAGQLCSHKKIPRSQRFNLKKKSLKKTVSNLNELFEDHLRRYWDLSK